MPLSTTAIELRWEHTQPAPRPHPRVRGGGRLVATVLFTDLVGSTELAAQLGDARWSALLARHDALVRAEVARQRGRVVKSLGDGALAVFESVSGALAAALAIRDGLAAMGLRARAGLHAGECELLPAGDVGGIAVHVAARVASLAGAGEVLASGTVRDLAIGSPHRLRSRGAHLLRGLPERWRVFAVYA